jgi:hypothetical protein
MSDIRKPESGELGKALGRLMSPAPPLRPIVAVAPAPMDTPVILTVFRPSALTVGVPVNATWLHRFLGFETLSTFIGTVQRPRFQFFLGQQTISLILPLRTVLKLSRWHFSGWILLPALLGMFQPVHPPELMLFFLLGVFFAVVPDHVMIFQVVTELL